MKKLYLSLFLACLAYGQSNAQSTQTEFKALKKVLEENHIAPRTVNDQLSKDIFKRFIRLADPRGLVLTQQDYAQLKQYETVLDDEYSAGELNFLKTFIPFYKERVLKFKENIEKIQTKTLDFNKQEALFSKGSQDTIFHLADGQASQQVLERLIKLSCLTMYEQQDKEKKQTVESFLPNACQIELRRVKRLLEHPDGFEQNLTNKYFSAITACYDPHSSYFNLSNVQNFIAQLSSQGLSFGIHFTENEKGELEIAQLVPGGAAWNSNKLHVGDILLKIQWEGKEAIDMIGASLEEIYNLMEQSNKGFALFTFKQKDGTTETIKLAKTVTRQDENTVKCFVIQNKKKIGYISLPGFYENCARDVGSAIIKMKKEGIEGLILDIRDNGGGSIEESADLAGIFIDQGGLFMTNSRQNKPVIVKDANRGTMYDAPLLVMVNRNSASASELLASTLQDYNRALIVGSQTFGKATGQSIFPLEANNPKTGYVKVTRLKLYRVTGKTAQFTGVAPDIEIPDMSEMDFFRESEMPYAIKPDTVAKKVIFQALPAIPKEDLRQNHFGRMTPSYNLHKLVELVKKANDLQREFYKKIPLDLKGFLQWNENLEKSLPTSESLKMQDKLLTVNSLQADVAWLAQDQYAKEMHQIVLKSISQDAHIAECYQILLDWIAFK